ncbi:S49 family peptidase [Wolbachia endosymbiont (group B) of Catoptria pinella]|uniref:S49 family peptidase n=1 Tax=Wolbachia endosymbiont (group B) of Catoptria pinella TaxID=2953993 RepID=UPI0022280089|nr:S49 family peptidase [Wolbachia endosymbiont (group B) of Catoptria pinella]
MLLGKPLMLEPRSFELLSLYKEKQPIFKNHSIKSNIERTAIIPIHGILTKKPGAFDEMLGMTSYEQIEVQVKQALEDSSIETILLDIDSPGGEVNGIFDLADFIYSARAKKRIVALANDDAYSAAYAIASSAEKIFLTRTSGVGSIGVIASHIDQSGFDEKCGIKYTTIFTGKRKNDLNPHEPISSESLKSLEEEVNRLYEILTELIARNRGLSVQAIKNTEAGLYFGKNAIEVGLADGITILSSINKNRSITMNEQTTTDLETDNLTKYRNEVLELIRLCNLSRMPEKIGEFIEQGVSVEQAREVLMELLAERTKKTEILSAIPQNSGEELMIQVARSRRS